MSDDPERDYLTEAQMILKGLTGLLPEKRHLEAMEEWRSVAIIKCANLAEQAKRDMLNLP